MHRKVLARSVRSVVEMLEQRTLLSATFAANAGTATISGTVYNDVNGNGIQDVGEPIVSGTTVTLSQVGVTYPVGTIPTVQADINGAFTFNTLAPGQYTVNLVPDAGFTQDAPGSFSVSVAANVTALITIGETTSINAGGSGLASIYGSVFNDANEDGVFTPGVEDFLAGDTVYLDLNGSGAQTAADPTSITDNLGQYLFSDLTPGSYLVRVVPRTGFFQSPPGYSQVTVYSDQTATQDIAETNGSIISGIVFQDINGDGVQEPGELPVAGETVFLDINLDGLLEPGTLNPTTGVWGPNPGTGGNEPFATTDANGQYVFTGLTPGSYRVIIQSVAGLIQDTPGYTDVTVAAAQDLNVNLPEGVGSSVSGIVYDDRNDNGTLDANEPGLADQIVFLDINTNGVPDTEGIGTDGLPLSASEPITTTDINGNFSFGDLGPGTYTMRFVTPNGATPSGPANPTHSYTFTLGNNSVLTGKNFGFETPDLTTTIVSFPTKPAFTNVKRHALVRVTNVGSLPVNGLVGINLWAQTTNGLVDETVATLVEALPGVNVHLKVGQSKIFKVPFEYPTQLPQNSYYISAQVVSTVHDNNPTNDFSAPVGPVQVVPPSIDLGLTFADAPAEIVDPGAATIVDLVLTNTGNVKNTGTVSFRFYLSQDPTLEPQDVIVRTLSYHNLHLNPGKSKVVHLVLPFPQQMLGSQYIYVAVDSGDALGETNLANNIALAPSPTRFD